MPMPVLSQDVVATNDGFGIFIPKISTLVIADLHLGFEFSLFSEGTYIPTDQFHIIKGKIIKLIKKYKPKSLLINGDFKHEFSRASKQEWYELKALMTILDDYNIELEIVRGNHDNYLKNILAQNGKTLFEPYLIKDDFLFAHGHLGLNAMFRGKLPDVDWLIFAHEHPAILLHDDIKGKHKFKCYLLGNWKKYHVLVLPAMSPLASGTILNSVGGTNLISPVLKEIQIGGFKPIIIDKGEILEFPIITNLVELEKNL
jgi:putative SbcD/Mre11-related phosphoesterase